MIDKKNILLLSYSNLNRDPRVKKQMFALIKDYSLFTAGYNATEEQLPFIQLNYTSNKANFTFHLHYPTLIRKFFSFFILVVNKAKQVNRKKYYENKYWDKERINDLVKLKKTFTKIDLIIANDIDTLPLALALKQTNTRIIFDAHEYHPREFEENKEWIKNRQPYITYLCHTYLKQADTIFTVCNGIAQEYKNIFNVDVGVMTNTANYNKDLYPNLSDSITVKLIHHGAAIRSRQIETMIEMITFLDARFELYLMLIPSDKDYYNSLIESCKNQHRIHFIEPVKTTQISYAINKYDIGVYLISPNNFNNLHSLPNKFFEYIQGRLAIAIGPSPEMKQFVEKYKLGIVSEDFNPKSLAKEINNLTSEKIDYYKAQSHIFAKELSAENNKDLLLKHVKQLLEEKQP